ncbi:secreted protein [Rhodopirellula islandica]|uniref:Secreted protein n=2 Tax=Rhodopirellula islandica TaxID=595434 RepID=A0A0J1BBF4_RHOIS|nr:secreted protein [Rhodopirellula islandica]
MVNRRRIIARVVCLVLILIFVPYIVSRIASSWRGLSAHASTSMDAPSVNGRPLRIACYNIAHGRGQSKSNWTGESKAMRQQRLDEIAKQIASVDADIVVLNEVDFDSSWSFSVNQAEYLAEQAGYPYRAEQRNLDFRVLFWKWRFGNAVLSRFPIRDSTVIDFPSYSRAETLLAGKKRGLECVVDIEGTLIDVAGVHLSHRNEGVRTKSVDLLMNVTKPKLIAGDFNSTPTGFPRSTTDASEGNAIDKVDENALFQRRPIDSPSGESEFTFHSSDPGSVIDWILASDDWQIIDYKAIPSLLSDHRMLVAEVMLVSDAQEVESGNANKP